MSDQQLENLLKSVEELKNYEFKSDDDRKRAMLATRAVSNRLMNPSEMNHDFVGAAARDALLKVCIDTKLFEKWKDIGHPAQSPKQLADVTGIDESLLTTILRHLAAYDIVYTDKPNSFVPTEFAKWMAQPHSSGCVDLLFTSQIRMFECLPTYFQSNSYQRPADRRWTPLGFAYNFYGDVYEFFNAHAKVGQALGDCMKSFAPYLGHWTDMVPPQTLLDGAKDDGHILVDVGGGFGQDIEKFRAAAPKTAGRLVLQDQPNVVSMIQGLDPGIEVMGHNYFEPQPIKQARAYYFHQVISDWPDDKAVEILSRIRDVMEPGYSKILICDIVMPLEGADFVDTTHSVLMMASNATSDRSESEWRELAEKSKLKVEKIWTRSMDSEAVIELVLP